MASEFGTGKTIFVLAIVVGCFAVLWPKVFYPMLTATTAKPPAASRPGSSLWKQTTNKELLGKLCYILEEHHLHAGPPDTAGGDVPQRWASEADCFDVIKVSCGAVLTEAVMDGFRTGAAGNNLTECLTEVYGLSPSVVAAAAPPLVRPRVYSAQAAGGARPERPGHLHPDMMHPALREKGRALPQRTIDKQARPGPMPGVRPPMGGGAGHISQTHQTKGTGSMSVIMPLYTVGIIIFFMYTIMKVLFKKGPEDDDKTPKLKDFHLDPEYRKYVFAEEYLDSGDAGQAREPFRRAEPREAAGLRRRVPAEHSDTKIEDEQMDQLRRRLEDTERAMERLMSQMGSVSDKLTAAKITEVLSQAQAQAKLLKTRDQAAAAPRVSPKASIVRRTSSEPETRKAPSSTPSTGTHDKDSTPKAESQEPCLRNASSEVKSQGSGSPNLNVDQKNVVMTSTSFPSSMPAQKVSFRLPDSYVETPPNVSDLEDQSSDATETGADVSELRSFAEESAENQAAANEGNENGGVRAVVQESVPEFVMPSYKNVPDIVQENAPEFVMPKYDDIPEVVQQKIPEFVMPKYDDIPEVEQDKVPEFVMPKYDDIPEVEQQKIPEFVMPKYDDIPEVVQENVPEFVMPKYDDIPEVVQDNVPELATPRLDDTSHAVQENVSESAVMPSETKIPHAVEKSVPELIMPRPSDIPEVSAPVGDTHDEPQIKLPATETPEINLSDPEMRMPSRDFTPELKLPVNHGFSASSIEPPLKMPSLDDKLDSKGQPQDSPSELKRTNKTTSAFKNAPSDTSPAFKIASDVKLIDENIQMIDSTDTEISKSANIPQPTLPCEDKIIKTTGEEETMPPDTLHFAPTQKVEVGTAMADLQNIEATNVPALKSETDKTVCLQDSKLDQFDEGSHYKSPVSDDTPAGPVQVSKIGVIQQFSANNSSFDPTITIPDSKKSIQDDSGENSSLIRGQMIHDNLINNQLYEAMEFSNKIGEVNDNISVSKNIPKMEKEPQQTLIQLKLQKVGNEPFPKPSQIMTEYDSDSSEADQVAVGTQTSMAFDPPRMLKKKAAEISTQTDDDRALSVMGLNTSWCVDQHGTQSSPIVSTPKIRDITLDVMLPSETQALVTQARMGSYSSKDLEEDVSEMGNTPCVITSQISLNIIGLEQNEDTPHSKSSLVFQSAAPKQSVSYELPSTSGRNANTPRVEPVDFAKSGAISKKISTTDLPYNTISVYRHLDIISPKPTPSEVSPTNIPEKMSPSPSREWAGAERDFMSSYPNSGIVLTNKTPTYASENFEDENRPRSPIPPSADESRDTSSNVSSGFFTDRQFGGPQFFSDTPDSLMEYSGWSTDAAKPLSSEYMTRSSTNFSDYPDDLFYEFPDIDSSTVLSNDVDTSFVGSMSSLDDDLMEPTYFACSVSYTPSSSVPQTPDQETEIKLACDPELSALADAALEDDTTLHLPCGSPPTTPTEDRRPHSPQLNEASSLSSKRSSPDMEEYEVIQKDPTKNSSSGQAVTAAAPPAQV